MCPEQEDFAFRDPTGPELRLLRTLVSADFQGAQVLAEQLVTTRVARIDSDGSLRLRPEAAPHADVTRRIPVEASYPDADGVVVHVLLHVVEGLLDELEIYREDSSRVLVQATKVADLEIESWST